VGDAGLLIFHEEYPLGTDVKTIFGLNDTVIDFEILANRPDCLCAWGVARETAVALKTEFKKPAISVKEADGSIHDFVKVTVKDTDFCPRYVARVVKNVRIGPSPLWLRKYLYGAGMRSINNVVDITNFVMLETGHPMHAFDLGKVRGGEIIVRKAAKGETIKTLDGKEHALAGIELLICDAEGPTGVAGIMGGEESEITESTRTLMFECAAFDRTGTRLAARNLGMRTEASGRFEKGVCPKTALEAMQRACQMINLMDAGDVVPGIIDVYPDPKKPQVVSASLKRIAQRTGVEIPAQAMVDILKSLHFEVKTDGDRIDATVPEFRQDVEGEADLSEEVLRIYGYESIPATRLRGESTHGGRSAVMCFRDALGLRLNGLGYSEIMNFSFISQKDIEKLNLAREDERLRPLMLLNPLGEDTRVMRPSLVPGMLKTLALNMNRGNEKAWLYEIAAVYNGLKPTAEKLPTETLMLCMGLFGGGADFYTIRDDVQTLLAAFGIKAEITPGGESYHHPGRCAVLTVNGQKLAVLGEVHPDTREEFGMPERGLIAEIDLNLARSLAVPWGK
jgi:phenylalanyl-tRNA synthetase beta chain